MSNFIVCLIAGFAIALFIHFTMPALLMPIVIGVIGVYLLFGQNK